MGLDECMKMVGVWCYRVIKKDCDESFFSDGPKNHKKWCNPIIFGKLIPDHLCLFNLFHVFRVPTESRMDPPRGALFSLQALLGGPGGSYRSLKKPEYLIFMRST